MHRQKFIGYNRYKASSGLGTACLRIILLFGSIAIALSLIMIPSIIGKIEHHFSENIYEMNIEYPQVALTSRGFFSNEKRSSMTVPLALKANN